MKWQWKLGKFAGIDVYIHAGQLVGIVTAENITEYLMIRSALKRAALTS